MWYPDTQDNDTELNDIQQKNHLRLLLGCHEIQEKDTQQNDIQQMFILNII